MTCKNCKSSWFTSPDIAKSLKNCPFCKAPLYVYKISKPDFSQIKKNVSCTIAYIAYEYDECIIWNKQKLIAYLSDIAPSLVKERRRIKLAFKVGAVDMLKNAIYKNNEEKKSAVLQAIACLMNEADVTEIASKETVEYFTQALGWNVSVKSKAEMWAEKALKAYHNEDYKTAIKFAKLSADYGNALAQNILGECFYWGHGVEVNEYKAVEWYKKAAENGDSNAMCSLADCYASGVGVAQNIEKARKYYKKSADSGNERALLEI